jgi:NIMA (never in mitosis gene a)-related kinase 1/4/5
MKASVVSTAFGLCGTETLKMLKKYKKVKYLGQGSYGAAILVSLKSNRDEQFVIKEIVIGHMKESEQLLTQNEVEVLKQMHHSNIAMYVESFVENSKLYIVMEYADGGDLSAAIQRKKKSNESWNEDEVMRIFVQICLALKHVHDRNIIHRDLKSQNIFLTSKGIVKLGDFGIAKVLDSTGGQARTQIGTPYYLSPEICDNTLYDTSSDIWSLGLLQDDHLHSSLSLRCGLVRITLFGIAIHSTITSSTCH